MAEEFFSSCIKFVDDAEKCDEDFSNFWFDAPLRFGLWAFLKDRLPEHAARFAKCDSQAVKPAALIIDAKAILLSDSKLTDSFGVVIFGSRTKSGVAGDAEDVDNSISILIRIFAPGNASPDDCDSVDLNILTMCVKRLLVKFTTDDLWKFENYAKVVIQSIRLDSIDSISSDSTGAFVRAIREFVDVTATFTVLETIKAGTGPDNFD